MSDVDLDNLLAEALHQARLRGPKHRQRGETHLDYAKRLAEKGLYRRLAREANAMMDASRFEWWFQNAGSEGLSLDQWRLIIDNQMMKARKRAEIASEAPSGASLLSKETAQAGG